MRQAGDRHGLLRQPQLHDRGEQLPRPLRASAASPPAAIPTRRSRVGRARSRRSCEADAARLGGPSGSKRARTKGAGGHRGALARAMAAFLERRLPRSAVGPSPKRVRRAARSPTATFAVAEARSRVARPRQARRARRATAGPASTRHAPLQRGPDELTSREARGIPPALPTRLASRLRELEVAPSSPLPGPEAPPGDVPSELDQPRLPRRPRRQPAGIPEQPMPELTAVPYMSDPDLLYTGSGASTGSGTARTPDTVRRPLPRLRGRLSRLGGVHPEAAARVPGSAGRKKPVLDVGCGRGSSWSYSPSETSLRAGSTSTRAWSPAAARRDSTSSR